MTPLEAKAFAERTLAAIDAAQARMTQTRQGFDTDRERVASDLAGLREHRPWIYPGRCAAERTADSWPCPDARRYADGLLRTARLYGVEP